jgi:phospholipid/cholesterol/gamma-HCH transport system ATP-binding protein
LNRNDPRAAATEPPPRTVVDVRDVHYAVAGRPAIFSGVSLTAERGRITAIMGPSGTGKTTLLRLMMGAIRPQQGRVSVFGRDVATLSRADLYAMRRRVGMLFQNGALLTDLDVFENVAFPVREHTRLPEPLLRRLVLMKLQAVGLRGAAGMMPAALSGGMARRVALARAIALDPPLIMYDEPFAGLDPIALATVAHLIRNLNDALDVASILVSHDIKDAFAIADYVYLLAAGRIAAEGTPDEMKASSDPNVRQFLDGDIDGPVAFHYQATPLAADLGLSA